RTVPYDREIFFLGEEISMAIRAYTAGYELYTPSIYVGSHLYRRMQPDGAARSLVWDADDDVQREIRWYERDATSKIKIAALCRGEWFGEYGIRNKARYQAFRDALLENFQVDLSRCKAPSANAGPTRPVRGDRTNSASPRRGPLTITGVGVEAISQMTLQAI